MTMTAARKLAAAMLAAAAVLFQGALPGAAQNLFDPAVRVNDFAVTNYELEQRIRFLNVLNQPGDTEEIAIEGLIDDRLRLQAAALAGITVTEEQIAAGMEEFAGRADLTPEEFIRAIGQDGVGPEAFRDFVKAGIAWREVVRARFGPRANITEAEIDRAIALSSSQGGVRVLMSEIIMPVPEGQEDAVRQRAERLGNITSLPEFAAAARQYSAAPSRGRGGRVDWVPIGNLPPELRAQVLTLAPGQVTDPISLPGAVAVFQLRAIEETGAPDEETLSVEYARYFIPGGRDGRALARARNVRDSIDTCDDLYGIAQGQPPEILARDTLPLGEVPQDIAVELAKLDENEVSTAITRNGGETLVFLMLCGRVTAQAEDISREDVRQRLLNQRLASYADSYLAELRADAAIVFP